MTTRQPPRPIGPGVAGLLSLAVFASLQLVPPVGVFVALLAPLPLLHFAASGRPSLIAWGWVAIALTGAFLLLHWPDLLIGVAGFLLVTVWPVVSIEAWVRRPWNTGRWLAIVATVAWASLVALFMAGAWPLAPADALREVMAKDLAANATMTEALGLGGAAAEAVTQALGVVAYLAPSLLALYVVAVALWSRPRLPLLGFPRGCEPFAEYASEEWLPVGFLLGGVAWVVAPEPARWLGGNMLFTVLGLYFIHGLAIIHFYLGRRLAGNRWVRVGVGVLCLQVPLAAVVSVLGLIDAFFRLRRGSGSDEEKKP